MGHHRSPASQLRLSVTSADITSFLAMLNREGIQILDAATDGELSICFTIHRRELAGVRNICDRRGDSLRIIGRYGWSWAGERLLRRPVLLAGLALILWFVLWMPTRIFFVRVEGNTRVPTRQILAAAEEAGICFGASRREVRSEHIKNGLLEAVPELQWAGVNTDGCVAVVTVREKTGSRISDQSGGVSSIVAACDGVILSANATQGSLLCRPGEVVTVGQVLISGYTDCGLSIRACRAQGEVYARTVREITVISPAECLQKEGETGCLVDYSLIVGKNRINLWKDSGKVSSTCGRMYEEYYITLPGGFQLPVAFVKETVTWYETRTVAASPEDSMRCYAEEYLLSQCIAGTIEYRDAEFKRDGDAFLLHGSYLCTEMIGRQKAEEIGELHE